jgi:L-rhamnose mutarotase
MLKKLMTLALTTLFLTPGCSIAQSQTLTWKFHSVDGNAVDIQFYSDDRKQVWPDHRAAYSIEDRGMHHYTISCTTGEKVCYGAWQRGNTSAFWGKGNNGKRHCSDCCYTCDGGTTPTRKLGEQAVRHDADQVLHFY